MQFKVKHANRNWAGVWEVESVERRMAARSPQVVVVRSDPPTTRHCWMDESTSPPAEKWSWKI